jgi:hypothetical protein
MFFCGNRRIVNRIARKNRRADKLIRKGKYNRALQIMHAALMIIEEKIGPANIALAKQHLKLARFRIREARRVQYEPTLRMCTAEIDRVRLSRSFAGRLVLRKLSRKERMDPGLLPCSELFGLLHLAEATWHSEKALDILRQTAVADRRLFEKVFFLLGKLYRFFEMPFDSSDRPVNAERFNPAGHQKPLRINKKGRMPHPAFVHQSISMHVKPVSSFQSN